MLQFNSSAIDGVMLQTVAMFELDYHRFSAVLFISFLSSFSFLLLGI